MTELCEVVMTAPDPEWLKDFSRKLVEQGLCASEVPGISTRTITDGNPDYLAWIAQETAPERPGSANT